MKLMYQTCGVEPHLDPITAASLWRLKTDRLLKVDVEWQTVDGKTADEDPNDRLEDFSIPSYYNNYTNYDLNWLNGLRYFPDAETDDGSTTSNTVNVVVSVPGFDGKEVKLKVFDVDDPTSSDHDTNGDVDDTGDSGDDNYDKFFSPVLVGRFLNDNAITGTTETTVTLSDDNGDGIATATVPFRASRRPGSNYRIAAELVLPGVTSTIDTLQVSNSGTTSTFVPYGDGSVSSLSAGTISDTLTVWRKLHIEVDSMDEIPTDEANDEKNYETGTVTSFEIIPKGEGQWLSVNLSDSLTDHARYLEPGCRIEIEGLGIYTLIAEADSDSISLVWGGNAPATAGQKYKIYDDDFEIEPLPLSSWSGDIINQLKVYYAPAFIEVEAANNPNPIVPFKLNESASSVTGVFDVWDEARDNDTTLSFWHQLLVIGFQPSRSSDSDGEIGVDVGGTPETGFGAGDYSVVYIEPLRESDRLNGIRDTTKDQIMREWISITGAHEIGHVPGSGVGEGDHGDGGLMGGGLPASLKESFSGKSIKRFRITEDWDSSSIL
jgi:hypothetical protein